MTKSGEARGRGEAELILYDLVWMVIICRTARMEGTQMDDVLTGAKGLIDFASSALTLSTGLQKMVGGTKAEADLSKLHGVIVSTHQSAIVALKEQLVLETAKVQLERRLEAFERWDAEAANYELTSVGDGVVAYRRRSGEFTGEPPHLLCPNCFVSRRKSFIQRTAETKYSRAHERHLHVHRCHSCAAQFEFGVAFSPSTTRPHTARRYDPLDG